MCIDILSIFAKKIGIMTVYVLVLVTFDYYAFHDNVFASTSKKKVLEFAKEKYINLNVYEYNEIPDFLRSEEIEHLLLQEF